MSTPEFQPKEFLVESNIYPHDLIDSIEDMRWIVQGKKIAKNDPESVCGGGKPIGECVVSIEMANQIINQFISGIEPELVDETKPKISNTVNPVSVDSSCEDCEMLCHAYGKTIDGEPSERIRFMYEDPDQEPVSSSNDDTNIVVHASGKHPYPIATLFEGPYFKQLP
jgi:hypothetical protein